MNPLVREYYINGQILESVHVYKDLGLITTRANRVLGLLKRTFNK